jgi:aspartyl-tRNA(Asn)/glutamyl-tRNA(Gln) amidotransferase subunit A
MIDFAALDAANRPLNAFSDWGHAARPGQGPLAGATIGIKSNIAVAGLPWTAGMALRRGRIAEKDAEVVRLLRQAGAAILGTLNMEEAAFGTVTNNPWFGATHNPHDLSLTAGGSSGGSGAAVAAGLCDAALGTDTMGSVRIPAAFCSVYGFKPANESVSQDGLELCEPSFDTIGPMARSLDLLERVTRLISDFGEGAAGAVLTLADLGGVECDPPVRAAYERACAAAAPASAIRLTHPLWRIRFAGFIATVRYLADAFAGAEPDLISPILRDQIAYGPNRPAAKWAEDQRVLNDTRADLQAAVAGGQMLLMPTSPHLPHRLQEFAPNDQADFTCLANVAGLPALSLPAGWSDDGRPAAVQLVTAPGHEAGLFAAARALDAELAAYRRPAHFFQGATA